MIHALCLKVQQLTTKSLKRLRTVAPLLLYLGRSIRLATAYMTKPPLTPIRDFSVCLTGSVPVMCGRFTSALRCENTVLLLLGPALLDDAVC